MQLIVKRPVTPDASRPERPAPSGQILVLFALGIVALIGFAAVAVDLGSYLKVRRDYQNAADAAALAGAPFLAATTPDRVSARHAAWNSLQSQLGITVSGSPWTADTAAGSPVTDTAGKYSLWVSTPPIGASGVTTAKYPGAYTGSADKAIFVWIEAQSPSYLSRIFGLNGANVSAWATSGIFPNRFAVITLRQPTQAGPSQEDIRLAGTNVKLTVIGGDVGGNWNMKLNSNNNLVLPGDSQTYIHDYISCGSSCWNASQVNNGSGTNKTVFQLPGPIPDPDYPLPTNVSSIPSGTTSSLGYGYLNAFPSVDKKSGNGNVNVGSGGDSPTAKSASDVGGVRTCDPANAVKIGPGFYTNIVVDGDYCIVLDPSYVHNCISVPTCTDTPTAVPAGQLPGVFYVTGDISVKSGGMIVGDGVTIVVKPKSEPNDNGQFSASGGAGTPGIVDLNATRISGGWTKRGASPYNWVTSGCSYGALGCWVYTNSYESDLTQTGMAIYIIKRDQISSGAAVDNWTNVLQINATAGLAWNGITYAPHDSATLAGQPGHSGVGQLVAWTFTFNGGTDVTQTYAGPFAGIPLLLEPRLGQP